MTGPNLDLTGRRALVCGASSGIGRATALALAAGGAEVVALARRADKLEAMLPELLAAGAPRAEALVADLDDRADLAAKVAGLDVQIVVHNTGGPPGGRLMAEDPEKMATYFGRHVLSAQTLLKAVLPAMEAAGYGRWINVLSTSVREPIPNLGVSNLIRSAMASWSKTLSHELPPGLTINSVLPGFFATDRLSSLRDANAERTGRTADQVWQGWIDMVPEGRIGDPAEIAGVIAFLASPAGAYVRGQALAVDGGRLKSI